MKYACPLLLLLALAACDDPASDRPEAPPEDDLDAGQDAADPDEDTLPDAQAQDTTPSDAEPEPTPDADPSIQTVEAWTEPCPLDAPEFRLVALPDVTLHVACQGSGPTIVLLHGFPEFWFGWSKLADVLAARFRVIMPDQRGYNLSDKPEGLENYTVGPLTDDISALIDAVGGGQRVLLVGHDWGGPVAWITAHRFADKLTALVILNGPHPDIFAREYAENDAQRAASSYVRLILNEGIEASLAANNYGFLAGAMGDVLSEEELALYIEAWSQPGALTAMLAWYRANFNEDGPAFSGDPVTVDLPTLVLWGLGDTALLPGNLDGLDAYVPDLTLRTYEGVGHFLAHEIPDDLAAEINAFHDAL